MSDEPNDATLQAMLEAWYGKPYPAGDNVQRDKADMRKVFAIARAATPAAVEEVQPAAPSSAAPGAEREMFEAWHYSIDGDSRGDYDDMFCAWQARAALQASESPPVQRREGPVADITETDTHFAKREGFVSGWNECLDALATQERAAPTESPAEGDAP